MNCDTDETGTLYAFMKIHKNNDLQLSDAVVEKFKNMPFTKLVVFFKSVVCLGFRCSGNWTTITPTNSTCFCATGHARTSDNELCTRMFKAVAAKLLNVMIP
jgi:hypothetical protein